MKRGSGLWVLFICCLSLSLGACEKATPGKKPGVGCGDIRMRRGEIVQKVTAKGIVKPASIVLVKVPFDGIVSEILVREGDHVKKGQPVAKIRMDPRFQSSVEEIRLLLLTSRSKRRSLEKTLARYRQLYEEGLAAQIHVEELTNGLEEARLKEEVALGKLKEIETKVGRKIDPDAGEDEFLRLSTTSIAAPVAGTVKEVLAESGESVSPVTQGSPLMRERAILSLADLRDLFFTASVNELDIRRLRVGQAVEIRFDSMPEKVRSGKIRRISSFAAAQPLLQPEMMTEDGGRKRFDVEIDLSGRDPDLRAGLSFKASFPVRTKANVSILPIESVIREGSNEYVLAKAGDSHVRRNVVTGMSDENSVEIVDGLTPEVPVCDRPQDFLESESARRFQENPSLLGRILGSGKKDPPR